MPYLPLWGSGKIPNLLARAIMIIDFAFLDPMLISRPPCRACVWWQKRICLLPVWTMRGASLPMAPGPEERFDDQTPFDLIHCRTAGSVRAWTVRSRSSKWPFRKWGEPV